MHNPEQDQNEPISSARLETMQASNHLLQTQLEQALARIKQNVPKDKALVERISISPRAIKPIQAFEAAIAVIEWNNQDPEYQISEYATGNSRWKHAPIVNPLPITDLLEYDVQNRHNKNRILGNKVAQVLQQNTKLSDEISGPIKHRQRNSRRPHHGLGHKDGGHIHVYQAQQRSSKIQQHGRFLLVGRTLFQKEGVKMTTKAKVKIQKVKVKVKAKAKIQKENLKAKI